MTNKSNKLSVGAAYGGMGELSIVSNMDVALSNIDN
jgi:hypothetical protein